MKIRKIKENLLHINHLRKTLGVHSFSAAIKSELKLEIYKTPPQGNVLVLAPHPDDDIIGCGGAISLHLKQNDKVKIIFFDEEGTAREVEAREAQAVFGSDSIEFANDKAEFAKAVSDFNPHIIYVPSPIDPNPDHMEVVNALVNYLQNNEFRGEIFSYEIWTPIFANRLLDITEVFDKKMQALNCHTSQLKDRDYMRATEGLAMYRAGMFNVGQYAEAFFACNKELFLKLAQKK